LRHAFFFGEGNRRYIYFTAVFCKNLGLHVRKIGFCGYGYGCGWEISYSRQACIGQGGKLDSHLMASCVRNIRTKAIKTGSPFSNMWYTNGILCPKCSGL